ncbi:MAG: methyltransferase domain-containing protein [Bacillota bacterium]|nr:methyltransferase domain-containing protein [Bacillota bacterium]MDW7677918.1 methyltransferase domain-containing protein [Bacillota bacterium]
MDEKRTSIIRHRYNRVAAVYDFLDAPMELMAFKKYRGEVMNNVHGKALEIGVGTGKNIEFYPADADIIAIDFSEKMLEKAKQRVVKLNKHVELLQMDVQNLAFEDNVFDTAFTTCVFCSVPDPVEGLKEIKRVLKPGGQLILLEHVLSKHRLVKPFMHLFNPVTVRLWGANINRKTSENIKKAGFKIISEKNLTLDIVKLIVAEA